MTKKTTSSAKATRSTSSKKATMKTKKTAKVTKKVTKTTKKSNINPKTGRKIAKGGVGKVIDHVEPLTAEEAFDFQRFLTAHNLIKGPSLKRMRIYRKVAETKTKKYRSKDFIYVVSADRYRKETDQVKNDLIALSKQVMDSKLVVENAKYVAKMSDVQEKLLMQGVQMNWQNGKSVSFNKIPHVITDRNLLKHLDDYFQARDSYDPKAIGLQKFKIGAKISELAKKYKLDWNKWCEHDVIMKGDKVIAAYSYKDLQPIYELHFDEGIKDKFGYNLNIIKKANLKEILDASAKLDYDEFDD